METGIHTGQVDFIFWHGMYLIYVQGEVGKIVMKVEIHPCK